MLRPEKLENIKREMSRCQLNILGLTEVRWRGKGDVNSDGFRVIHSGGDQGQRGVALLLDKITSECVCQVDCVDDRLLRVKLNGSPKDIVVIVVYMPTTDYDDEEIEAMYEKMEDAIGSGRGDDYVIVLGDMNAVVGNESEKDVTGSHGLGNRNERGQMLIDFCKRNHLSIMNTWFKQCERRIYTWTAPGNTRRRQLDYIMVKQRYKNSVKNAHAYPGADADSDHNLVAMKVKLKLKRIKKPTRRLKWKLDALKGPQKEEFSDRVKTHLQNMNRNTMEVNTIWTTLKNAMKESAEETIGHECRRRAKKPWVTEEMLRKMDERRRWKQVNTPEGKQQYRKLNNELRRETDRAKEKYWEEQCEEIEEMERAGKMDKLYRRVKELTWKKETSQKNKTILDKQGTPLTDPEAVKARWKEYIEELYSKNEKPEDLELEPEVEVEEDQKGPDILRREIEQAIKELKTGKAEGEDGIPAEMIKALDPEATHTLMLLCTAIYKKGEWPEDFLISTIVPLEKKPNAQKCEDFRTISLISNASKILLKIINNRLRRAAEAFIGWDQFGFRRGMGTREAIAVMRTIGERSIEHDQPIYICFVDYEKAFDRVNWPKLMTILKSLGIDWRDRRLISALYMGQSANVRTEHGEAGPCVIGRGVRQGCLLSPQLFNIYAEAMMKEAMEDVEDGVHVGGHVIQAVRFADDQAMIASSVEGLQNIMTKLNNIVKNYKMKINEKKTKVMKIGRGEAEQVKIVINGNELEQVHQFKYLGSLLTEDGRSEREIKVRISMAKEAFEKHKKLLTENTINKNLRKRLIKTLVWSVLLYGSETWTMRKGDTDKLESCEMWMWRRMEKVTWRERVRNEEVLRRVGEKRSLLETIWRRKAKWIGHILRSEGLLRTSIEGRMKGKKPRGRRRKTMLDDIREEKLYHQMKEITKDRDRWRRLSCAGPARGQTT